jgi:SagB-type dehydrogenase family enzyme
VLDAADTRSLALLFHLNSDPWRNPEAGDERAYEVRFKEMPGISDRIPLPGPEDSGALLELIGRRSSCREFAVGELALAGLAEILAGTQGLTRTVTFPDGFETRTRPVPSAGGLYPLELYLVLQRVETLADGLYHYNVRDHALEPLRAGFDSSALAEAVLAAPLLENANALVFMTAVYDRTLHKYGNRGYRYILLEAGHAAQNLCLVATGHGLATLCVGAFMDSAVNTFLELDPRTELPVYCVGIGHGV